MKYTLAISPCPNDTFMMHALLKGHVHREGMEFDVSFLDIQELNAALSEGRFDFCKVSSIAALDYSSEYQLCSAGAALGYGVGPLLLKHPKAAPLTAYSSVLCPGANTTACALFGYFYPEAKSAVRHRVFSDIMPALERAEADFGVVIHEGRFTYQAYGLERVADLGAMWESTCKLPLPLGCIVARRTIHGSVRKDFEDLVRSSITYAYQHREEVSHTMRQYAQELGSEALWSHVDLYVNQWSLDLGAEGKAAFEKLKSLRR